MKKKKWAAALCLSVCLAFLPLSASAEEGLQLDSSTFSQSKDAVSSITDKYGIPLFTDQYAEQVVGTQQKQRQQQTAVYNGLFAGTPQDASAPQALEAFCAQYRLFDSAEQAPLYQQQQRSSGPHWLWLLLPAGLSLFGIVWYLVRLYYHKKLSLPETDYLDYQDK